VKRISIPRKLQRFDRVFEEAGHSCFLVGGAVRSVLLGEHPTDYDFATDATPKQVFSMFKRVIPTGVQHGTVTVIFEDEQYEVTTFRVEGKYSDSRRPDSVEFTPSIEEDLARRDFTINAVAADLKDGTLIDPHGGRKDLKKGLIRAIGTPYERFAEDGLRLLRACRFAAKLEFEIEGSTLEAMKEAAATIDSVSAERIREELDKTMEAGQPSTAYFLMEKAGLLLRILPELARCRGVEQGGVHRYDVLDHSLYSCDGAPAEKPDVRYAALLHDIGKAVTAEQNELGDITFYGHEEESEEMAHRILRRFRFSRAREKHICHLIRHHMFHYTPEWSDSAVRRFISRVGKEYLEDIFDLRQADRYGILGRHSLPEGEFRGRISTVLEEDNAFTARDLAVNGYDLMQEAGIPKGPLLGKVIDHLLETVIDDPGQNTKEKLLRIARSFYDEYLSEKENS
jgi:poly(A) polymerase/tRNA nucleotidyltransferase (CCA-adding enzyme)